MTTPGAAVPSGLRQLRDRTPCAASIGVLLAAACLSVGCNKPARGASPPPVAPLQGHSSLPAWLPDYSAEQRQLLAAPAPAAVGSPAPHVYPLLDYFAFADSPAFDVARADAARKRVDQVIAASDRLYVTGDLADPQSANWIAQYGPAAPPEPDPWVRAVSNSGGRLSLIWATPAAGSDASIEAANAALARRDLASAESQFAKLAGASNDVPALWILLGEVQASRGNDAGATQSAQHALSIDPRSPDGHRLMAEIFARKADLPAAKRELALALAGYPLSPRSWAVAKRYFRVRARPAPAPSLLEVGADGSIRVSVGGGPGSHAYLRCRAAIRYEPDFRKAMLGLDGPYRLSMGEELMCHEVWLAAYAATKGQAAPDTAGKPIASTSAAPLASSPAEPASKPASPNPPGTPPAAAQPPAAQPAVAPDATGTPVLAASHSDELRAIAAAGHLPEYVLFDVVGQFRPEWLRVAPRKYHLAIAQYLEQYVLN